MKRIVLNEENHAVPLSRHELKDVVGGIDEYHCVCTFYDSFNNRIGSLSTHGGVSGALDDYGCEAECSDHCNNAYNCSKYVISFNYRREECPI